MRLRTATRRLRPAPEGASIVSTARSTSRSVARRAVARRAVARWPVARWAVARRPATAADFVKLVLALAAALVLQATAPLLGAPSALPHAPTEWVNLVDDQFGALTTLPAYWQVYDGPYGSLPGNCASPSHIWIGGGVLHLRMAYETSGKCGAGWYTAGMKLDPSFGSIDARVTVRFRVVGGGVTSHDIIPMRWPTTAPWPQGGEEDYCERDPIGECSTFLHYGDDPATSVSHGLALDLSVWHTVRAQRAANVTTLWVDDLAHPAWTFAGDATTLPPTLKTVVLQQECLVTGCPTTTAGWEEIEVSSIVVDAPAVR